MSGRPASKRPLQPSSNGLQPPTTSHTYAPSPLDDLLAQNGLTRYHLAPPSWRAPWLPASKAGAELQAWPEFYPTCDNQQEDMLTEQAVKSGFGGKPVVQTETFSAHQMIYEKLKSNDILGNLSRLAAAVKQKQDASVPTFEAPSFRLPKRNTITESRRDSWFADLANPAIPLSKLYAVIPQVTRGVGLLEQMYQRKIQLDRAVWFIRAYGAADIQSQVSRPRPGAIAPSLSTVIANYTQEWTVAVQEFVRKQLAEIAGDSGAVSAGVRAGLPRAAAGGEKGKAVLVDEELRRAWTAKFSWTLQLLTTLSTESLLTRDSFLRFLIAQIETSTPAQLPFSLFLVEEYLGEFLQSEPLAARMVSAALARLVEFSPLPTPTNFQLSLITTLTSLIRSTFLALPDAFVAAPLWSAHHQSLEKLLQGLEEPKLRATVTCDLEELRVREEAASRGAIACGAEGEAGDSEEEEAEELETIQILDLLTFPASLAATHKALFRHGSPSTARRRRRPLASELPLLFTWSTTSDRAGHHRRYAAAALIRMELDEMALRGEGKSDIVERGFVDWVDGLKLGGGEETVVEEGEVDMTGATKRGAEGRKDAVEGVRRLLEELCRSGVVAFSLYLQRMIARGETEERGEGITPSIHLTLLKTVALFDEAGNPLAKRRVALRSSPSSRAETQRLIDVAKYELFALIPSIADETWKVPLESPVPGVIPERDCTALLTAMTHLAADGSHLVIQRQIIPRGLARLVKAGEQIGLSIEDHAILTQTYIETSDHWGLLQYILIVLRAGPSRDLLGHLLDVLESDLDSWTAMGELGSVSTTLFNSHRTLKSAGVNDRRLIALLRQFGVAGHLEASAVTLLEQDFQEMVLSLSTSRPQTTGLPPNLPELQSLIVDHSPQAIAQLGTTLWYRYHAYDNWGVVTMDSCVQLLTSVTPSTIAHFLREINERLPTGLETQIAKWVAMQPSQTLVATFGGPLGPRLATLLNELVTGGVLSACGAVTKVILPAWRTLLAEATSPPTATVATPAADSPTALDPTLLQALETVSTVFGSLVGNDDLAAGSAHLSNSPASLIARQRAASRRMSLYTHASLADIGRCISLLVIQLELWTTASQAERARCTSILIQHVNSCPPFQMAVARDPQTLATAMLDSPFVTSIPAIAQFRPKLLAALLLTLKDGSTATPASLVSTEDWDLFLSGLTMWRLAISKVEVQACLERLDLDHSLQDADKAEALHTLSRHFLDRVCSGEGHTYLGEQVVKCYHGPASDELVSVAFTRLSEAVEGLSPTASPERRTHSLTTLRCTGRVLNTLLQSGTAASRPQSLNQLLQAIKSCLEGLVETEAEPAREAVLHSTHLLAIALRCTSKPAGGDTPELFKSCLIPCAKLAASLSKDRWQESDLSAVLLDTCSHLLFGLSDMAPTVRLPSLQTLLSSDLEIDALPDSTLSRLTRLFGPASTLMPGLVNPWELVEHADAGAASSAIGPSTTRSNAGPIDLALFDARIVQVIPQFTALDAQSTTSSSTGGNTGAASMHAVSERGKQGNFDFETPCIGLSVAARDHRRTMMSARATVMSRYDPSARTKKTQEITIDDEAVPAAKAPSGTKRKDAPEVVIIDSDEDDAPLAARAPPAKRGRGATAGKSVSRGTGRKKPK